MSADPRLERAGSFSWLLALQYGSLEDTKQRVALTKSLYEAEVAYNDAAFGALLQSLRHEGLLDNTFVIFLSDHGQEFDDGHRWQHGGGLSEKLIRIPLLIRPPGGLGSPFREESLVVQHVDILPTLLDLLNIPIPSMTDGTSLLAAPWRDVRRVYAQQRFVLAGTRLWKAVHDKGDYYEGNAVIEWPWKLIHRLNPERRVQLFDLASDPGETRDLSGEEPEISRHLLERLQRKLARATRSGASEAEIEAGLRKQLEALGYAR